MARYTLTRFVSFRCATTTTHFSLVRVPSSEPQTEFSGSNIKAFHSKEKLT